MNGSGSTFDHGGLLEELPVVAYVAEHGSQPRFRYMAPHIAAVLGLPAAEIMENPDLWAAQMHPDDRPRGLWRQDQKLFCEVEPPPVEYRMIGRDGRVVWFSDRAVLRADRDGANVWKGVLHDITDRKTAELELQRITGRQSAIAQLAEGALSGTDADSLLGAAVSLAAQIDGVEHSFVWERPSDGGPLMLRAGLRVDEGIADWRRLSAGEGTHAASVTPGGRVVVPDWDRETRFTMPPALEGLGIRSSLAVAIEGSADAPFGVIDAHSASPGRFDAEDEHFLQTVASILAGAQGRIGADERLRRQVLQDQLTGLPNRVLFVESVAAALADGFAGGTRVAVLFLDLDRFKLINDSLGHQAGDDLLSAIAQRLRRQLRPGDSVARFGGDEFGVLVREVGGEGDAVAVAGRIMACFEKPFVLNGVEHFLGVSMGIASSAPGPVAEEDAEALIRDADTAMYRAKDQGRARWEVFDHTLRARAVERLEVERELRLALEREEFTVHYQPIISVPAGAITGVEALVRWRHPERGLLQPGAFIEIAEDSGLIEPMGRWVQEEACRQIVAWDTLRPDARPLDVSVNLSARQVARSDLAETTGAVLARTGLDPSRLRLELTETVLIEDSVSSEEAISSLQGLGVRLALDDFGTGYSSLAYLHRFPFDSLKIDRSFVAGLGTATGADGIVAAIVGMARALGLDVVAEGVETATQHAELNRLGVDYAQGYLFSRPVPPEELAALLSAGGREGAFAPPAAPALPSPDS